MQLRKGQGDLMKAPGTIGNSIISMTWIRTLWARAVFALLLFLLGAGFANAAELKDDTRQAWEDYVRTINVTIVKRGNGGSPFLWVDESPELGRRVRAGELLVASHDVAKVPHGLIHHWVGAMFIPDATLEEVARVLDDYDHYAEFYRPIVARSKLVDQTDDCERVTVLMVQKAFSVTAAVQADEEIHTIRLDANRIYSLNSAVHVQEIANYGRQDEHLLPEGQGPGYMWRMQGITRIEERDGGVYVEMETIALSRGIPVAFRWLIKPLTEKLPRDIMFQMLNDTGAAVKHESAPEQRENITEQRASLRK
jgi:hypothetical protein